VTAPAWSGPTLAGALLALVLLAHAESAPDPGSPPAAAAASPDAAATPAPAPPAQQSADLAPQVEAQRIEVVGEQPGPGLWKISRGDHVLWILGTLSPLPKQLQWRPDSVEKVLGEAGTVLRGDTSVLADLGPIGALRMYLKWRRLQHNTGDRNLRQLVPEPLYARFAVLKERYAADDDRIETLAPVFAARRLYEAALESANLESGDKVPKLVLKLAKKHKVAVRTVEVKVADPDRVMQEVLQITPEAQVACLEATVERLETDLKDMDARAAAWAAGDVGALLRLPYPDQVQACWAVLAGSSGIRALAGQARAGWLAAALEELERSRVSLALLPIEKLVGPDGALQALREQGCQVQEPL